MINVRGIANAAIQAINPNIPVVVMMPNGFTVDPATRKQIPAYTDIPGLGQLQALDADENKQVDSLNIQGTIRGMYLYGSVAGVMRPDQQPSASIRFTSNEGGVTAERHWNVFKVLETWATGELWCKVAIVLQGVEP